MSERAARFATTSALPAFQQAAALHAQGRLREAEQIYEAALRADDRHFDSTYRLGLIRLQRGRFADAAELFRRAAKIDKKSADAQFHLAVALTGLDRPETAISRYEKALAIKPEFAEAHNNLGYVLQKLGRNDEAATHYERALTINPAYAEARNNLGNALHMLGRFEDAIAQFEKALAIRPNYAEAYNNLGNVFDALRRHQEAIAHYEKALAIRPNYVEARISLGNALATLGREEAAAQYEKALALDPKNPDAHSYLANTLLMLGRADEARAHCEMAIAIKPDHIGARNNLGVALRALGRLDHAIDAFEQAIAMAPDRVGGYLNLAGSKRFSAEDRHFAAMQKLKERMESLEVNEQIGLHFALGKAFADVGDRQQSFHHLLQGNSLKRQQVTYDERKALDLFERIRKVFSAELMRNKAGLGDPSRGSVFIIGMPRSGTSLVEQILATHPKVFGAGELREMAKLAAKIIGPEHTEFPEAVVPLEGDRLAELGATYLRAVRPLAPRAERITDKMPGNFVHTGLINLAVPNARIIHVRRDPRDVALSCFSILFQVGHEFTYDLGQLGRYIRAYQSLMEHWRHVLPDGVMLEVQYEELVDNLDAEARRIVAHCGLDWDDACVSFYNTERPVLTASATQVRRPVYRSSVGRWRPYRELLGPLLRALEE